MLRQSYPQLDIIVQSSEHRIFRDYQYRDKGIKVVPNLKDADLLIGIKEVSIPSIISGKTYLIFSHTFKKQIQNKPLLEALIKNKCTLIDYELLKENGKRVIAFGRYAGIVGGYNALIMALKKYENQIVPRAFELKVVSQIFEKVNRLNVPALHYFVYGRGRAAQGAIELFHEAGIKQVPLNEYNKNYSEPIFTQASTKDIYSINNTDYNSFELKDYSNKFHSKFLSKFGKTDVLVASNYWNPNSPKLFTLDEVKANENLKIVSDITCDINGSIPTTVRSSNIQSPFYDIDKATFKEKQAFSDFNNITVAAIDNLPCEVPFNSSIHFGNVLNNTIFPELLIKNSILIEEATIIERGVFKPDYNYLSSFIQNTLPDSE